MNSPDSWIDSDEIRALLPDLVDEQDGAEVAFEPWNRRGDELAKHEEVAPELLAGEFLLTPLGPGDLDLEIAERTARFPTPEDVRRIGHRLAEVRAEAERSGLLQRSDADDAAIETETEAAPETATEFVALNGPLVERLEALLQWVRAELPVLDAFVIDDRGHTMTTDEVDLSHASTAIEIARSALERGGESLEAVNSIPLADGTVLTVAWRRSDFGLHCLGIVTRDTVTRAWRATLARAMHVFPS